MFWKALDHLHQWQHEHLPECESPQGNDVLMVSGTDEHGTPAELAAFIDTAARVSPEIELARPSRAVLSVSAVPGSTQ